MSHSLRECLLLLPCNNLEDLPESVPTAESRQLLNGWLALWHPKFIVQTQSSPRWQSADQPPHDMAGILAAIPDVSLSKLPSDFEGTTQRSGGWSMMVDRPWRELQTWWLVQLELAELNSEQNAAFWQIEFAALGYAYMQVQLLTRQLRYTSNLDQVLFDSQLRQAAQAIVDGDAAECEKMLQSCFDQLGQERDHYYSLDVSLLDVTLLASTTLGSGVAAQLERPLASTFVANAALLRQMQNEQPAVAAKLKLALAERRISLAGGLDVERPHPLMSFESLKRDLESGRVAYQELGLSAPVVFTRQSFGQLSDMPLHLRRSGFIGAMLIAWQEGAYPCGSHAKFSWEAAEGTFLNAIAPAIGDANDDATFLTIGRRIADALDHQHVPLFMLAHWPNSYSSFFELLFRVVMRTPALGRWQTADDFFEKTDQPYHQEHLPPRKFAFDWLAAGTVEPSDLVMCSVAYQQLSSQFRDLQHLLNLSYQLENFHSSHPTAQPPGNGSEFATAENSRDEDENVPRALPLRELDAGLANAAQAIDSIFDSLNQHSRVATQVRSELNGLAMSIGKRFAKATGHQTVDNSLDTSSNSHSGILEQNQASYLMANATSSPLRIPLTTPSGVAPAEGAKWLYASSVHHDRGLAMIDLPGFSLLAVPLQSSSNSAKRREAMTAQNSGLLINDFLEVQVDPTTGNLRSLHIPGKRGNRLSLQLARREKSGSSEFEYSSSRAASVRAIESSAVRGIVRANGQLQFKGQRSGEFEIDYELSRGSRILSITVRLDSLEPLRGTAWTAAYVLRTAWPDESTLLTNWICGSRQSWPGGKAVAPSLIGFDDADHHTYLLTGGLPFHQRVEERYLETILTANPARGGEFRIGIGIDLPNPVISARQFCTTPITIPIRRIATPTSIESSTATWLMNIDARQVVMDLESPLIDRAGNCAGIRIHLSEIAGRSQTVRIRSLRDVAEAHRVDYLGGRIAKLTVDGDSISIALRPNEMTFVDVIWQR